MKLQRIQPLVATAAVFAAITFAAAGLPEPDTVFYGSIALDGTFVTSTNTEITVELRRPTQALPEGFLLSSYRMGDSPGAGNRYTLRARMESEAPLLDPGATLPGDTVRILVRKSGTVRETLDVLLTERGEFRELNFGDIDSDGDGMSDGFERQFFGSSTGGDANLDSDLDGRPNSREFLQGTDPTKPDGRHPADIQPANWILNIQEITEYALAWKLGTAWSIEPTNIPVDYVTRASALWVGGETYTFDNDPVLLNPPNPLWWVNAPLTNSPLSEGEAPLSSPLPARFQSASTDTATVAAEWSSMLTDASKGRAASASERTGAARPAAPAPASVALRREAPSTYTMFQPIKVSLTVTPFPGTRAYAVEEQPPAGWLVRFVTGEGRVDSKNSKIKWGPFYGTTSKTVTYELTPMSGDQEAGFTGVASFDGRSAAAVGTSAVFPPGHLVPTRMTIQRNGDGTLGVFVQGSPNAKLVLETSSNLGTWASGENLTLSSDGLASKSVTPSTTRAQFFRVRHAQ